MAKQNFYNIVLVRNLKWYLKNVTIFSPQLGLLPLSLLIFFL
jgi:hypothetical protein